MANTEILNTLKQVRLAEDAVNAAILQPGLTAAQKNALREIRDNLDEIDDTLVLQEINDSLDQLSNDAKGLEALTSQIKQASSSLQKVASVVETASKAVGALVDIMTKAASAGLI